MHCFPLDSELHDIFRLTYKKKPESEWLLEGAFNGRLDLPPGPIGAVVEEVHSLTHGT